MESIRHQRSLSARTTARSYRPDIRVVPQEGIGKGDALRTGFLAAQGDVIVMIDADRSMSPQEISHFLHFLSPTSMGFARRRSADPDGDPRRGRT